ncbi:MAG TPA: hypothetical protein VGC66_09555 [Pyrinomonadaceae bacterium]|jgi:hypothetical protein
MILSDSKGATTIELIYEKLTDRLVKELVAFAIRRSKELRWRTGNAMELPGGETPQSIVSLAILRAAEGTRRWNPETHPDLGLYLKGVIRSLLNHLATGRENTMFLAATASDNTETSPLEIGTDIDELSGVEWLARAPLTPEEELLLKEHFKAEEWAAAILDQAADEDEPVSMIIRAMRSGCDPGSDIEIADETGLPVVEVRKAKKRLNRLIDRVGNQVRESLIKQPAARRTKTNEQ